MEETMPQFDSKPVSEEKELLSRLSGETSLSLSFEIRLYRLCPGKSNKEMKDTTL